MSAFRSSCQRLLTPSRVENIICAVAMGVVGIWCMHFVGYVTLCAFYDNRTDFAAAIAPSRSVTDETHYNSSMPLASPFSPYFCL